MSTFAHVLQLMRRCGVGAKAVLVPLLFSILASIAEGLSMSLLIPVAKGFVSSDFSFVDSLPVIGSITASYPEYFQTGNTRIVILLVGFTFLAAVTKVLLQFLSQLTSYRQARALAAELRKQVFDRLLSFGKLYFDVKNSGYLHQVTMQHVSSVANSLYTFHYVSYACCTLGIYLTIMCWINWKLTALVLLIFPALHFSLRKTIESLRASSRMFAKEYNELGKSLSNTVSIIPLIQSSCPCF